MTNGLTTLRLLLLFLQDYIKNPEYFIKVDYSADLMSDRDWLKSIDEVVDDDEEMEEEVSQSTSRKSKGVGRGGKRRRGEEDDLEDAMPKKKKKATPELIAHLNTVRLLRILRSVGIKERLWYNLVKISHERG